MFILIRKSDALVILMKTNIQNKFGMITHNKNLVEENNNEN